MTNTPRRSSPRRRASPPASLRKAPLRRNRPARRKRKTLAPRLQRWHQQVSQLWRMLRRLPRPVMVSAFVVVFIAIFSAVNLVYQVAHKPTELLFPFDSTFDKTPAGTWRNYAPLFREYSTATITPELLAALAQVESDGNPMARTYWRWRLTWHPFAIYQPASSSIGLYQMTDAAFADARRYCIRHHAVVTDGCWLTGLYSRLVPSHAIELTAIFLDRAVAAILARRAGAASPRQVQELAALIHLCGAGPGEGFARRGFRLTSGERCGGEDAAAYLARVETMKQQFQRLAARHPDPRSSVPPKEPS